MQKTIIKLPAMKLVGITARTNNANEANPTTAKISLTLQKYFVNKIPDKINYRKNPGVTYCIFTNYESDVTGDYTYFVGEEVTMFDDSSQGLEQLNIPEQTYAKLTTGSGPIPQICIEAWQEIWKMGSAELGGKRAYISDFEIYDERAADPQNTIFDIYIGLEK